MVDSEAGGRPSLALGVRHPSECGSRDVVDLGEALMPAFGTGPGHRRVNRSRGVRVLIECSNTRLSDCGGFSLLSATLASRGRRVTGAAKLRGRYPGGGTFAEPVARWPWPAQTSTEIAWQRRMSQRSNAPTLNRSDSRFAYRKRIGSKLIFSRAPTASANFSKVRVDGVVRPASSRAMLL